MPKEKFGHFYIDQTCIGCGACDHACPGKVDAIYRVETDYLGRFAIISDECINCGICVPLCPVKCIHDARTEGVVEGEGGYTRILELQAWAQAGATT
ncbi:MAG: NADH-quinone oxidoreductase subunit I [Gammaproteobacteria bacterium]